VPLTEGEHDHLFFTGRVQRIMDATNVHSVTTRLFTAREGGEQNFQVGNSALARDNCFFGSTSSTGSAVGSRRAVGTSARSVSVAHRSRVLHRSHGEGGRIRLLAAV
jgi:hypothetical protein